ncbi:MAG TPA: hypothetical protein VHF25_07735 [Nitriliruptorales bacterium]|nr:hypothetical protein [Nitriliruptorales bacterium]
MRNRALVVVPVLSLLITVLFALWPAQTGGPGQSDGTLRARFGSVLGLGPAHARRKISIPYGFEDTLVLRDNRRLIEAVGPFGCETEDNARWRVDITVEQAHARAQGHTQGHCSGRVGQWEVLAVARGPVTFDAGPAEGCGVLLVLVGGTVTDSVSWCDEFQLVAGS